MIPVSPSVTDLLPCIRKCMEKSLNLQPSICTVIKVTITCSKCIFSSANPNQQPATFKLSCFHAADPNFDPGIFSIKPSHNALVELIISLYYWNLPFDSSWAPFSLQLCLFFATLHCFKRLKFIVKFHICPFISSVQS